MFNYSSRQDVELIRGTIDKLLTRYGYTSWVGVNPSEVISQSEVEKMEANANYAIDYLLFIYIPYKPLANYLLFIYIPYKHLMFIYIPYKHLMFIYKPYKLLVVHLYTL